MVKNKLPTIFTSYFHGEQQTNSCLHRSFKNMGSPYNFLYESYLKWMKNKHEFIRKSEKWYINNKLQTFFSPNLVYCEVFICSTLNKKKSHRSPCILRKYRVWLYFYPISVSISIVVPAFSTIWQYFFVSSHFSHLKGARFTFNAVLGIYTIYLSRCVIVWLFRCNGLSYTQSFMLLICIYDRRYPVYLHGALFCHVSNGVTAVLH